MWRTGLSALLSHWRRHPGQLLTLVLGLSLATALWTGVQAVNSEARAGYDRAAAIVTQNALPSLVSRSGDLIPLDTYVALRRAGWNVAPVIEGEARLGGRSIRLIGLDPLSTPVLPAASNRSDGTGLGQLMASPGQLFGAEGTVARLGELGVGQPALVVSNDLAEGILVGDIGIVASILGNSGALTRLVLLPNQTEVASTLDEIAPGLEQIAGTEDAGLDGLTGSFHLNLTAFGLMAFFVGLFIVHGAVGLAFEQRRSMFRTMLAIGLPRRVLMSLLACELGTLALVAGSLGVLMGFGLAGVLLPGVAATLEGLYGAPAPGALSLRPSWALAGLGMSLLGTLLASGQSLVHLHRLPVLALAQPRAWRVVSQNDMLWQGLIAAALIALAGLSLWLGSGLVFGFLGLGTLLLGAALAMPPLLVAFLTRAKQFSRGPVSSWFWADSLQQVPGLSLALMALMLAMTANIGVSTMVGSFRLSFTSYLDQRLASEAYVDAGTERVARQIEPWLEARAETVLPRGRTDVRIGSMAGTVQGLSDHETYRARWPLLQSLPGVWDSLAAGDGVLINEQLHYRSDIDPGDTVDIDGVTHAVLGIYSDYGNPRPQAVMGMSNFVAAFPDAPPTGFALRLNSEDVPDLLRDLAGEFGISSDQMIDQSSLKALSLEIFEQTFLVTDALSVLTLSVAALAVLTSLLTLAGMRLPQVAPVWAIGLPRRTLGLLELMRAAAFALFTGLISLPVGLALAWVLLEVINVEAFGWRLPLHVFPLEWLFLILLAVAAALVAAAIPARRLARRSPRELLGVFANER